MFEFKIGFYDINKLVVRLIFWFKCTSQNIFTTKPLHKKTHKMLGRKQSASLRGNREADQRLCFRNPSST